MICIWCRLWLCYHLTLAENSDSGKEKCYCVSRVVLMFLPL